ncbi:TIM44-like domain-containing protein [Propionivibrio sp.]|uniref:Tim44 domain-containing protein n=1 Tax=Propionivibrio sp. TaxID=2212460 RepID=UPI00260F9482|nr:TIM44-like domain-containing protein [Propionivibrio sp.]
MKKILMAFCTVILALGLSVGEAEAARLGGGKSLGMQRQSVAPRPAAPAQQATPTAPVGAPAAAPKRNWMGPLAGLAAGLGIAALLSHFGMGEGMSNILMIALLAMAAVFVLKWLFGRKTAAPSDSAMQYAGAGGAGLPPPVAAPQFGSAAATATVSPLAAHVPEGFDSEGFLRIAKLNFVRLQAANDAKNMDDIREFVAPEMFAEIKMQMDERGNAPQQTDVVTLNAELLEVTTEANRHVASVHFSGMIREVAGAAAAPFDEVWNLSKPTEGGKGWVIAGIQQLS